MAAPNPALVVNNPPPLNPTAFPFAVNAIDWQWLASFAGLVAAQGSPVPITPIVDLPPNPLRYSYGS